MTVSSAITVQLVDDHEVVRIGFRYMLEEGGGLQVVVESAGGKQACRDYDEHLPDIVIMDISLPDISGLEAMRRILRAHSQARVLMLSMHTGVVAERAMQLGARGYVCKSSGAHAFLSAVQEVMRGGLYLDKAADAQSPLQHTKSSLLTLREIEVCMLLAEGRSVAGIAVKLCLSEKTVYTHRQHIMNKLGVTTTVNLLQVAARMGILG